MDNQLLFKKWRDFKEKYAKIVKKETKKITTVTGNCIYKNQKKEMCNKSVFDESTSFCCRHKNSVQARPSNTSDESKESKTLETIVESQKEIEEVEPTIDIKKEDSKCRHRKHGIRCTKTKVINTNYCDKHQKSIVSE